MVSTTTRIDRQDSRTLAVPVIPSPPGICTSISTTSGTSRCACTTAAGPSSDSPTTSILASLSRIAGDADASPPHTVDQDRNVGQSV